MIEELYYQLDRFLFDQLMESLPTKDLKQFTLMAGYDTS